MKAFPCAAGMVTEAFSDFVVGHGELWCAQLFDATLRKMGVDSKFMDTRDVLVVTATSDGNSVDVEYEDSNVRLDRWAQKHGSPTVIPLPLADLCAGAALLSYQASCPLHWGDKNNPKGAQQRQHSLVDSRLRR